MIKIIVHLQHWDVNNLYGWEMSKKLPVNNFEGIQDNSKHNEGFIKKTIIKKMMKDIFSKLMFHILKNYKNFIKIYHFYKQE